MSSEPLTDGKPEALPKLGGIKGLIDTFQEVGTQIKEMLEELRRAGELNAKIEVRMENGRVKIEVQIKVPGE